MDGAVLPGGSYAYTPFGVVASGNTPSPFGFTGELQSQGLVYLRTRWYDPSSGVFTARDPFAGFPTRPYSLHYYQYGYSNPVLWTDPSGERAQGYPDYVLPEDKDVVPDYAIFLRYLEASNFQTQVLNDQTKTDLQNNILLERIGLFVVGGSVGVLCSWAAPALGVSAAALPWVSVGGGGITFIGTDIADLNGTRETLAVLIYMEDKINAFKSSTTDITVDRTRWPWVPYIAFWYDPFRTRLHSYYTWVDVTDEDTDRTTPDEPDETYHPRVFNLVEERRSGRLEEKNIFLQRVKSFLNQIMGPKRAGN